MKKINILILVSLKNVLDDNWNSNLDNLTITFNIKGKTYYWEIFSIYTIPVTNDYLIANFKSDNSFEKYIEKVISRSIKDFNEDVLMNDKILTLSTCYNDSNYRLVVRTKMVGGN